MPTTDIQSPARSEDFDCLVQQVELYFRQATKRFAPPSISNCRTVAIYLTFRHPSEDETLDARKLAIKYGKLFLRHIEPERRLMENMVSLASQGQPIGNWIEEYKEMVFRIEEIRRHMEAVFPSLSPKHHAKRDPIRTIASAAQLAWSNANDGRSPQSKNPDDPLCRFLVPALAATGLNLSPAAISEILRGRRHKT